METMWKTLVQAAHIDITTVSAAAPVLNREDVGSQMEVIWKTPADSEVARLRIAGVPSQSNGRKWWCNHKRTP